MKLVKNTQWDPKTDSVRHQYVDGFNISMNHDDEDQTKTLLADQGEAKNAMMFTGQVATTQLQKVVGDKQAMQNRTIQGYAPYVWQLNFNLDRIKDKKLRDAITLALPNARSSRPTVAPTAVRSPTPCVAPTRRATTAVRPVQPSEEAER